MQKARPPTALFGGTSELSKLLYTELLALHIAMPQTLSFVGYGHVLPFEKPRYNTIAQPTSELGVEAVRVMGKVITRPGRAPIVSCLPAHVEDEGSVGRRLLQGRCSKQLNTDKVHQQNWLSGRCMLL